MSDREKTDAAARAWVERYVTAWNSNDEADIAALFTPDAEYRYEPWGDVNGDPERGLPAITSSWLESRDEPGDCTFEWDIAGIDGDRAFVQGRTVYAPSDETPEERDYANLWVIDLADDGRARSFTEWYMRRTS